MTSIGELDQRIQIQRLVRGADDGQGGNVSSSWVQVCEEWAKVEAGSGKEMTAQDQTVHRADYKITMRRRTDLSAAMKVRWEHKPGSFLEMAIIGIPLQTSRGFWTVLTCSSGAPS